MSEQETTPILDDEKLGIIVDEAFNHPDTLDDWDSIREAAVQACRTVQAMLRAGSTVIGGTND